MIKNKQVNLWRGPEVPPTLYHIWLKDEKQLLRYDEDKKDWVVFLDSYEINRVIQNFMDDLDNILDATINGHPVRENPELVAQDIKIGEDGHYFRSTHSLKEVAKIFDNLMTTYVYEQ